MADRALALVPNPDAAAAKRKRGVDGGGGDEDNDASLAPGSSSDPSLALVVPATGGPAITKAEYEKRLKDVRAFWFLSLLSLKLLVSIVRTSVPLLSASNHHLLFPGRSSLSLSPPPSSPPSLNLNLLAR